MAETLFIPIDYDYFDWEGKNYLRVIGRNEKGKRLCVIDRFNPYLWAILKKGVNEKQIKEAIRDIEKIKIKGTNRITKVIKTEIHDKNFLGKPVKAIKIFISNYKDAHEVADNLDLPEIEARRGYDVPLLTKYIIESKLVPLRWYKIKGKLLNGTLEFGGIDRIDIDECYEAEKIEEAEDILFQPKILAFDIEAGEFGIGKGEILMISLVGKNFKKVLSWKKCPQNLEYVECFESEADMIEAFVEYVRKESPDILAGYFSDGFDMPYLRARAEKNKVRLALGLDNRQPAFARGRIPSASLCGIVHLDIFRFIDSVYSQYLTSETLGLNDVASELLGEGKKDFDVFEHVKNKKEEWKEFFEYNLQDSVLTYKLTEKLWPDMLEFSKIIQEPLFEITRSSMSQHVENYLLHNLEKYNEIEEKRPLHDEIGKRRQREKYEGAFVFQPTAGLYENLAIFDFTSMHASIIVSYNLSKTTLLEKKEGDCFESPELELEGKKERFYFSKTPGFFPSLLGEIVKLRKKYKKELKEKPDPIKKARSNAYKLLANAYYGYMGFFGARYYSIEAAASTLAFVRKFNKWTMDQVSKQGYGVVFGDTDSCGFTLNNKTKEQTKEFLEKLNSELPGIMELELEDFYKRGIWVKKRTGDFGAKKKYALIDDNNKLKVRGFETVRRDWCDLARQLQNKVLQAILEDGNEKKALELIKETIKKIKNREVEKKDIMIRTQLKKPLDEYKAITPHVIAARKIKEKGLPIDLGMLLEYFIAETKGKKKLVREKVKLPDEKGEYNIKYYLERQIIPAVENIIEVFGINIKEIIDGKKQATLGEF